jgi:DNA-binding IscR family transcriptional regulator
VALAQMQRERGAPVRLQALMRELSLSARLAREGLAALAAAGLAVEARQGGWLLSRDPARITLAQVRAAARSSLRFPTGVDDVSEAILRVPAESAAEAVLTSRSRSRFEALPPRSLRP